MPRYRLSVDIYDDIKGDGSELGAFRGTDETFTVEAADAENAVEVASPAIVAEHGHAWLVKTVTPASLDAKEGDVVEFRGPEGETLWGPVTLVGTLDSETYFNVVIGKGESRVSYILLDSSELTGAYGVGDSDEFYDHDNLPFPGEVIEVGEDGVLYVSSRKLTKNVWVDPISMRITENSVYDYA